MSEKQPRQIYDDITIADLYPGLSPEQQVEAEHRLLRYLAVVKSIFEDITRDNPKILTELERRAMLRKKKNNSRHA
jgi:hypothetical protein